MSARRIVIDPVTRIEGHAKISLQLDDSGQVTDAAFHVVEFRGFEKFCEGRPLAEMPALTARICGICPVSHLLASAKAGDAILAVQIPPAAEKLRRLMNLAQIVQSHALSYFYLSAPDLLLGWDAAPDRRNVFGLAAAEPETARDGVRLRRFGQEVIEALGGHRIHPAWAMPGGVRSPLAAAARDRLRAALPEANRIAERALERFRGVLDGHQAEAQMFGNFPSLFLGHVDATGGWEHYGGHLRFVDSEGNVIADRLDPARYADFIGEAVQPGSYLKSPYYKPLGYPAGGMYRVGPLARLNVCSHMGTPRADEEWRRFRSLSSGAVVSSFHYHYARLIEIVACLERMAQALEDPDLLSHELRADAGINCREGVGASEAPRGTLFHHYRVDANGGIEQANFIIATGQNNLAMNRTVAQIARHYLRGNGLSEPLLNRIEAGIRCYDPCLSCSTHAAGTMPLAVELVGSDGTVRAAVRRPG